MPFLLSKKGGKGKHEGEVNIGESKYGDWEGNVGYKCKEQKGMLLRIGPLKLPDSSQLHRHDDVRLLHASKVA